MKNSSEDTLPSYVTNIDDNGEANISHQDSLGSHGECAMTVRLAMGLRLAVTTPSSSFASSLEELGSLCVQPRPMSTERAARLPL